MSYSVSVTPTFKAKAKRLIKKYASLKREIEDLIGSLEQDPQQGTAIGKHCYKVRLAIKSKGAGKSGGARVITYVFHVVREVHLLTVYDKAEQGSVSRTELEELLKELFR